MMRRCHLFATAWRHGPRGRPEVSVG